VFGRNAFRGIDHAGVAARRNAFRIDHIGIAVADLDEAIAIHRDTYGMPLVHRETITEQGVEAALLGAGDSHVELLAPLGDDTPVGRFLAKRGPGLHHVAYRVDDLAAALDELRAAGVRVIDEQPRTGVRGSQVAFLDPAASAGVLTELVQPAEGRSPVTGAMDGAGRHQGAGRMKGRGDQFA
jgi:methylmalonyl-CoA/ethylmalonyl-CoA epimerase